MLDFDSFFSRHDPYASFVAGLDVTSASVRPSDLPSQALERLNQLRSFEESSITLELLRHSEGLDLRPMVLSVLAAEAFLVDIHEVFELTCINVSRSLQQAGSSRLTAEDVRNPCQAAVEACVQLEAERCNQVEPVVLPLADHLESLRRVFEISEAKLRTAVRHINELPKRQRLPLVKVFLRGESLGQVVMESGYSAGELTSHMQVALRHLMLLGLHGGE